MKKLIITVLLITHLCGGFAEDLLDSTLNDLKEFFETNQESISSISFGINGNNFANSVNGEIVKVITEKDYNNFYRCGVLIECTPEYYFHGTVYKNKYYILISNINVNQSIKVGTIIEGNKTIIGSSSNNQVPFNGGNDTKIVVFTYEKYNKHLIALSNGFPGTTLPGIDDLYIFPGEWLMDKSNVDYLAFFPVRKMNELITILKEITGGNTSYNLDPIHTISTSFDYKLDIMDLQNNIELKKAIELLGLSYPAFQSVSMTKYARFSINDYPFYIMMSETMGQYYQNEIKEKNQVLYLRSVGSFPENNKVTPILYLVDFQPFYYEDKVQAVIEYYSKK